MHRNSAAKEELQRRRSELLTELFQMPESFELLCSLAHRFGELCGEEAVLDNPQYARSGVWRMNRGSEESFGGKPMSHHLHSVKTEEYGIVNVVMGFDSSGGHIFCTVKQETTDQPLYNSMDDDEGGTHQLDVEYYRAILALLGLVVPESMFREVERDQALRVGSRYFVHD